MAPAITKEHIVEFLCQVPAGFISPTNWVLHNSCAANLFGSGKHVLISLWRLHTNFLQYIFTIYQMLGIRHKGNGHDFTVNSDQLILL